MSLFLYILIGITLFWIAYQDFKSREIYLISFGALFGLFLALIFTEIPITTVKINVIGNLFLLCPFVVTIIGAYYVKNKSFNGLKNIMGLGDVLLVTILAGVLHPSFLLILIMSGSVFSLIIHVLVFKKKKDFIPYAGYLSLTLIAFICIGHFYNQKIYNPLFLTVFDE